MSAIPPDIIGSAIQAAVTQREVAKSQDADRAGQSHASRIQTRAVAESTSNVETTDNDTQVFTDAEGSGSQGRHFEDALETPEDDEETEGIPAGGVQTGPDGRAHLDVQA